LIEKQYGHIDKHRTKAITPSDEIQRPSKAAIQEGDFQMHTAQVLNIVDRMALTVMNAIVFVGLPVVALGLFVR
jgi:hypothetical protein